MADDNLPTTTPPPNGSIDSFVRNSLQFSETMKADNVVEARKADGTYYHRNTETGESVVASTSAIVIDKKDTIQLIVAKPGASKNAALLEVEDQNLTQKVKGAFIGTSQPDVSNRLTDKD